MTFERVSDFLTRFGFANPTEIEHLSDTRERAVYVITVPTMGISDKNRDMIVRKRFKSAMEAKFKDVDITNFSVRDKGRLFRKYRIEVVTERRFPRP